MSQSSRLALAAVLGLAGLVAHAEEATVLEPVTLQKQMSAPVSRSNMKLLTGTYLMQDGRDLRVDGHGLRMRISLGKEAPLAMTPSADGVWHSADGALSMRFHGEVWGSPDAVVLTMPSKHWSVASVSAR